MPVLLKVNGRDLSAYVNVQHDDGLDPVDAERIMPEFSGSPAFQEGSDAVGETAGNRAWVVPLIIDASSRAALHRLAADINNDLVRGAQVEFATDMADPTTFFDLEAGRLDVQYQYFLSVAGAYRATLNLWTRPYGYTGTARTLIATAATGPLISSPATGIVGDADALGKFEARVGSQVASTGRIVGYGYHQSASYNAFHQPTTSVLGATGGWGPQASAVASTNPTAIGQQHVAIPVSPTGGATGVAYRDFLAPVEAHQGRHRVFAIARSGLDRGIPLYAKDRFGAILGPTAQASVTDQTRWGLVDLGEVQVPARASGQEAVPTQYVEIYGGGASGNTIAASPALQINQLVYLPLNTPGLLRTMGAAGGYTDTFSGSFFLSFDYGAHCLADSGQVWVPLAGILSNFYTAGRVVPIYPFGGTGPSNASGVGVLASGAMNTDVQAEITVGFIASTGFALTASTAVDLYAKARTGTTIGASPPNYVASQGVWARLILGPSQMLQIWKDPGGAPTSIACAGIASTLASGLYQGQAHRLVLRTNGGQADAWLATGQLAANPILSASNADISQAGWPVLRMNQPSGAFDGAFGSGGVGLFGGDNFSLSRLGASAPDTATREWFRFEGHPDPRAYQGNASIFVADRGGDFRGELPRIPPTGSPVASSGGRFVAFTGEVDNFNGTDVADWYLGVVERFSFLR